MTLHGFPIIDVFGGQLSISATPWPASSLTSCREFSFLLIVHIDSTPRQSSSTRLFDSSHRTFLPTVIIDNVPRQVSLPALIASSHCQHSLSAHVDSSYLQLSSTAPIDSSHRQLSCITSTTSLNDLPHQRILNECKHNNDTTACTLVQVVSALPLRLISEGPGNAHLVEES